MNTSIGVTPHFDGRRWFVSLNDEDLRVTFAATDELLDALVATVQRRVRYGAAEAIAASGVADAEDGA